MSTIVVVIVAVMVFLLYLLLRNSLVHKYRLETLEAFRELAEKDIHAGRDWEKRAKMFEAVSYRKMVFMFWRRLDSFFPKEMLEEPQ